MGGLVGILSILNLYGSAGCVITNINQERDEALILQMPRKTHLSCDSGNPSCYRLCGLVKKPNEELHAGAELSMEDL